MPSIEQIEKLKEKNDIELEKSINKTRSCLKKDEQLEHRKILAENEEKERNRKARTKRLIERGAMLESFIPSAENVSNDEVMSLLKKLFSAS
ncbi:MAG: DUF3847 domain-containing protein [Oscillospiraceae bacterium]|nr:DUF3847 domain-containing protein [Oscillospiraceae bacterium]